MSLKTLAISAAAVGALGLALSATQAAAATVVHVGDTAPTGYFFITSGTPISPSITADFGATVNGSDTPFDYQFVFTIPQNGIGSGSLSTSFSSVSNELTISSLKINGHTYTVPSTGSGQSVTVGGIPIHDGVQNTIEVIGDTAVGATAATFSGTATFAAGVPEPASWIMMIGGLGMAGAAMRRRRTAPGIA